MNKKRKKDLILLKKFKNHKSLLNHKIKLKQKKIISNPGLQRLQKSLFNQFLKSKMHNLK